MPRILAIDYGLKRTGLAWSDLLKMTATGLESVDTKDLERELKRICATETIEAIVLGFPTKPDGSDTHTTEPVRKLRQKLETWFPDIPVKLYDERYTTRLAHENLLNFGAKKKDRRDKYLIDQVAATIILQEFLNLM